MSRLKRRRRGSALLLVITVLVLLSIMGTTFMALMRIERGATRNYSHDVALRQLARKALAFVNQHPTWNPPRDSLTPANNDVDNDNIGDPDSQFFTYPLADATTPFHARFAILKKPFRGRLNVNLNSFYVGSASDNHILNQGASVGEISLVDAMAAHLHYRAPAEGLTTSGDYAENEAVAEEIARRICNLRHGQPLTPLGAPPNLAGTAANALPGEDGVDDDVAEDQGIAFRPDPDSDRVDNDGDGLIDESGEGTDEPDEFTKYNVTSPNDDQPFEGEALDSIILNTASDLKTLVNEVCQVWAPGQGYAGYNAGEDYFDSLRHLFTTYNCDYIPGMAPLNHMQPLFTVDPAYTGVQRDRAAFRAALTGAFETDGMPSAAARLTAWQVLANLIDYLDDDVYGAYRYGVVTALDAPAGEGATRAFFGTERFPHFNEFWIYNRGSDEYDNDGVNGHDGSTPPDANEVDHNGYYIELTNLYRTFAANDAPIYLYNHLVPADPPGSDLTALPAGDPHYNWRIRVTDDTGTLKRQWDMETHAQKWVEDPPGTWGWQDVKDTHEVYVPAGGQLVIVYHDYHQTETPPGDGLPDPAVLDVADLDGDGQADIQMIRLGASDSATTPMFEAGDLVELVYHCDQGRVDTDGNAVAGDVEVVVDRQHVPSDILTRETAHATPQTYHFAPSWERRDPRLARCTRIEATAVDISLGDLLIPTWEYRDAEGITNAPGGGTGDAGEETMHTLGYVNDDGDTTDSDPFDGNYDLGEDPYTIYDDLVDVPNDPSWKFANVGALGKLLCVGPLPIDPTAYGWSADYTDASSADPDYWLITASPYTSVPSGDDPPDSFQAMPLDTKKIDFITDSVYSWNDDSAYDVSGLPSSFPAPTGRAAAIFDHFTVFCPWRDGKDNDGEVNEERDEIKVYGRVGVNEADEYTLAALPYVKFDDSTFDRTTGTDPQTAVDGVFLTTATGTAGIIDGRAYGDFADRRDFLTRVVRPAVNDVAYDPANDVGAFAKDAEDNHWFEDTDGDLRRDNTKRPYEWDTLQLPPRTVTTTAALGYDFILPGQDGRGGDGLTDDKSEVDYTVGALMNMIATATEVPESFEAAGQPPGLFTYYITVQITDGLDVDNVDDDEDGIPNGTPADPGNRPDWKEGTVLAERRLVALVNNALPTSDPARIRAFTWWVMGRRRPELAEE